MIRSSAEYHASPISLRPSAYSAIDRVPVTGTPSIVFFSNGSIVIFGGGGGGGCGGRGCAEGDGGTGGGGGCGIIRCATLCCVSSIQTPPNTGSMISTILFRAPGAIIRSVRTRPSES